MVVYRRNLPHWFPEGKAVFITWHLHGSYPNNSAGLRMEMASPGQRFRIIDRELDRAASGPDWLRNPAVAECVLRALKRGVGELQAFRLFAFVIMPNHVHLLIEPRIQVARITNGIKGYSSRLANQVLGRTGQRFWQDESFDHWVRNQAELIKIQTYIEHNPVTAGLAERPEDWPWSSASIKL
jgi:REP element-mobilizing transposase RayT